MKTIETERLILRPFIVEDIEASYQMNLDPLVSRFTGDGGVLSYTELEQRITKNVFGDYKEYGYGRMAVELKSTGKFIGFSGLKYLPEYKKTDLGYRFFSEYWGNGYATESGRAAVQYGFHHLDLDEIIAMVLPENSASIHVLEKLGFSFEKTIQEDEEHLNWYTLVNE